MNKIFIESKKEQTAECNFLKAILAKFFPDKAVQFVCMNGVGNLFNETNRLAQKELHGSWWDCFEDYEKCVSCAKDDNGSPRYLMPNRKAKLHTYISSQKLSNAKRDKLGAGNWLFEDTMYWDLNRTALLPLIDFLRTNLN